MGMLDEPITMVGFFLFFLLIMNTYAGVNPVDTVFVQGAALLLEIPFIILGSVASNFWLALPIVFLAFLFYMKAADGFLGSGVLAWVVVAWFIIALAGWGAI